MRYTKWEGFNKDGSKHAVLVQHDGLFAEILQPALAKLAMYEDMEDEHAKEIEYKILEAKTMIHLYTMSLEMLEKELNQ